LQPTQSRDDALKIVKNELEMRKLQPTQSRDDKRTPPKPKSQNVIMFNMMFNIQEGEKGKHLFYKAR